MELNLEGKVYGAEQAKIVAKQLQESHGGKWNYTVEEQDGFARIAVSDSIGTVIGYY